MSAASRARTSAVRPPAVHDGDPGCELVGLVQILGGEQDGRPGGRDASDDVPDIAAGTGVQTRGGLVEKQHRGGEDQPDRKIEPSSHAAGIRRQRSIRRHNQVESIECIGVAVPLA